MDFQVQDENPEYPSMTDIKRRIILLPNTTVNVFEDVEGIMPKIPFKFSSIEDLEFESAGEKKGTHAWFVHPKVLARIPLISFTFLFFADLVAIIVEINEKRETAGKQYTIREIDLTDKSKETVRMTLWGSIAENFEAELYSTIVIRKCTIGLFDKKKSLNSNEGTLIWVICLIYENPNN